MRSLSPLACKASIAIRNLSQQSSQYPKLVTASKPPHPQALKSPISHHQRHHFVDNETPSTTKGKNSSNSSLISVNFQYISRILSRADWVLILNHEFKAGRIILNPQSVVSVLQNQRNPLYSLRFYIWVSNIDPLVSRIQSVKGVLANVLNRQGPVVLSTNLLDDIKNSGFRVTEELLCLLVCSWGKLGLANYCVEIFGQISFLGINPTTRLYNSVIDALVKSDSLDSAYLKFQQMSADGCKPDRFTYNILIHGVCKIGVLDEAFRLVKQMESSGYSANVYTYTILIDGLCNAKRADEAFRLVDTMKQKNICPTEVTIRSLVHGVFRSTAPDKAFSLVISFIEKNPILRKFTCDTLLYCLCTNSMAKEAAAFLRKIGNKGYLPESSLFDITITCFIKGLNLNETCEILDNFLKRGLKLGFNSYISLMEALCIAGKQIEGDRYYEQMVKNGLLVNVFSYNMVIDCLCKVNMVNKASSIFNEMQLIGIAPNLVTFNTFISVHGNNREVYKAREFLEMLLKHGFKPDTFTFTSIIDGLCKAQRINDAFGCFSEMVEWGVTPNAFTYNILMRSLCVAGDIGKSMQIMRKMKSNGVMPDIFSFNAVIQSFCRMKKVEKAKKVMVSLSTMGLKPDIYTYTALIKAMCESGKLDEAKEMFLSMEINQCAPDSYVSNLLLDHLVQNAHFDEACEIRRICKEKGISVKMISSYTGNLQGDDVGQLGGGALDDPAQIASKALLCFNDKYIYSSCDESYRLTASGNINVPYGDTNQFCSGPCRGETHLVLNCINNILAHFLFYNRATILDVRDTIKAGCGYGPERGNFDVAEHIRAEESKGFKGAASTVFILGLITGTALLF